MSSSMSLNMKRKYKTALKIFGFFAISVLLIIIYKNENNTGGEHLNRNFSDRITCEEYYYILDSKIPHILIDVRSEDSFKNGSLPNAINIPKEELPNNVEKINDLLIKKAQETNSRNVPLYLVCGSGYLSGSSVPLLKRYGIKSKDIIGGLAAWKSKIDPDFPLVY
ncbi:Rhodanese-like protein [Anaeromyces robustus]|uniref:Rhodanese-like protein n=1 Tax=Anaeromyces robustus TaxID=1754192 RepID=A0A1Y1X1F7_9FUNG|nr:Rhodanese-like protein [Anaeromyces robustus]|eukprot:ORX79651.1 Rhodanese-like protein [Anaeromyces robustus]